MALFHCVSDPGILLISHVHGLLACRGIQWLHMPSATSCWQAALCARQAQGWRVATQGLLPRASDGPSMPYEPNAEAKPTVVDPLSMALDDGWHYGTLGRPRQPMVMVPAHPHATAPTPVR